MAKDFTPREFRKDAGKLSLEDVVAPIFDATMGKRLGLARMKRLWRLEDLAPKLGLNSETLRRLEAGTLAVPKHAFSISKLEDVFGEMDTKFIVLDRYGATYCEPIIRGKFWGKVYRERKTKPRGDHWTRKRLAEGKPVQGYSFQGIPGDIWDEARRLFNAAEKKRNKSIK